MTKKKDAATVAAEREARNKRLAFKIAAIIQPVMDERYKADPTKTGKHFHTKTHAVVNARLEILDNPPEYQVGIFAKPGVYPIKMRYSAASSGKSSDTGPGVRGLSIRLHDEFEQPIGMAFTMQTMTTFPFGRPELVYEFLYWSNLTRFVVLNVILVLLVFLFKGNMWRLLALKNARRYQKSLSVETFYSVTPYQFGDDESKACKYGLKPLAYREAAIAPEPRGRNYLTEELDAMLSTPQPFRFEFCVQLQTNKKKMPVQDTAVEWEEDPTKGGSSFVPVGIIHVEQQQVNLEEKLVWGDFSDFAVDEEKFPMHKPLGDVNRVRKYLYAEMHRYQMGKRFGTGNE
ncbi:hypothetical protein BASA81_007368 [Batrachochytrium salamandrivorans]|nr:hypothetical protein BASA81_007368 [Batrachochytrium salamandrivorans]